MEDTLHVLQVPQRSGSAKKDPRGRTRELLAIAAVGGRVRHDSGGRLMLVELPGGAEAKLKKLLVGAKLAAPEGDLKDLSSNLDAGEKLFLEALRIRYSSDFRERKARRRFGESPEEELLSTGSCVRGY